jgi:hypothetical protein
MEARLDGLRLRRARYSPAASTPLHARQVTLFPSMNSLPAQEHRLCGRRWLRACGAACDLASRGPGSVGSHSQKLGSRFAGYSKTRVGWGLGGDGPACPSIPRGQEAGSHQRNRSREGPSAPFPPWSKFSKAG